MGFTSELVTQGRWTKRRDGVSRELTCHPDGTLTEWDPARPHEKWSGTWDITRNGEMLNLRIGNYHTQIEVTDSGLIGYEAVPREHVRVGEKTPVISFTIKHILEQHPVTDTPRRQYLPFLVAPPRFPSRADLPISGPRGFVKAVTAILDELESKRPNRYKEVVEYLPKATYDPEALKQASGEGWAGNSSGLFGVDGSRLDSFFYIFLHEVGHNVAGHHASPGKDLDRPVKEAQAHAYAEAVLRELGRKTIYPEGYNYTRYET